MNKISLASLVAFPIVATSVGCQEKPAEKETPAGPENPAPGLGENMPNILFVIADDQSYPHTSAYGSRFVSTPGFDRVASEGALFTNFYVTSPGSSPSRASMLTGLYPWQIAEAGTHASSFPAEYICFPDVLKEAGYLVGYTGKGWGPGDWQVSGRPYNPAGPAYNEVTLAPPYSGISKIDYSGNFKKFLSERKSGQPFCFWLGGNEPHRSYQPDSWERKGLSLSDVSVPEFLPDHEDVKGDLLNYAIEIEWFDSHLVSCLDELERTGELDNTIVIVTADNGMPFPRAKSNCYDAGIHVPLAIYWGDHIQPSQVVNTLTSSVDFFPTLLDAAGLPVRQGLSGQSLLPLVTGNASQYVSDAIFAGRERHSSARYDNLGYPIRCMRSEDYLLIWNLHPERWPAGDPQSMSAAGTLNQMHKAYYDIDGSPSKTYIVNNYSDPQIKKYFDAAMARRSEFELYNLADDPYCMTNLADDPSSAQILETLQQKLMARLNTTGDTRLGSNPEIWETYPRLDGELRYFPAPTYERENDYFRAGWELSSNLEEFDETGNCYEGSVDGLPWTFAGFVKPGRTYRGVYNPSVEGGGHIQFTVDMKEPKTVNYFRIRHKNEKIWLRWRKFSSISASLDGEHFKIIATDVAVTDYDKPDMIMTPDILIPETECRYLRFYADSEDCWDTTEGSSVQLTELYFGKKN